MPIQTHENEIPLEEGAILWRYISFEKYKSLLQTRALFFCRAEKFADPYEFSIPRREYEFRISPEKYYAERAIFGQYERNFDLEKAKVMAEGIAATQKKIKTATTVNCWHINNNESDAMWQIYLKNNEGVAIRTNKDKLYKTLEDAVPNIGISKVRYINYATDIWYDLDEYPHTRSNFYIPVFHKRIEFRHENELRIYHHDIEKEKAGYWDNQPNDRGELINIDLSTLIESVIFHPTADELTKNKIIDLTKSLGQNFNFVSSDLSKTAYY